MNKNKALSHHADLGTSVLEYRKGKDCALTIIGARGLVRSFEKKVTRKMNRWEPLTQIVNAVTCHANIKV